MDSVIDCVVPSGAWTFDAEVAACFPDMLRRSIPDLDRMRELVLRVGRRFVRPGTDIVDLGCSRGDMIVPFWREFGATNRYVLLDNSPAMTEAARAELAGPIQTGLVEVRDFDLRRGYPTAKASLTLAVLTLQFIPVEYRPRILREAWRTTVPGGALILVEKTIEANAEADDLLVSLYLAEKAAAGYNAAAIEAKRRALENVLVPLTPAGNVELLRAAGYAFIVPFWRSLQFAGWVAVRS
jgi:tRNA (cmo5U34)-methyltransferase